MNNTNLQIYGFLGLLGVLGPILFPAYTLSIAFLWVMVVMATTWDALGGQMGYNSLGNITFFGVGMYVSAIVQVAMFYEGGVGEYTSAMGSIKPVFTEAQYFLGLFLGILAAGIAGLLMSLVFSSFMFGLRGPYFAIGSLGLAIAAAEITITIDYVGGPSGISMPLFPGDIEFRSTFFYMICFALAIASHVLIRWLYSTQFGLAANAIRDDEDKAVAMGIKTLAYKRVAWGIAAFFMGAVGAVVGNMIGFIDKEVAYPIPTFGIFMVAAALLGGKGTLWGPVLGAIIFHVIKDAAWTLLLGFQWIALGLVLIVNIVYFQQGIVGWLQTKFPEKFGIAVDVSETQMGEDREQSNA
ncbi:MAG: branched-chain amino acid ABC transporter permease [Rhodospirillaceae bacterium]|nr:branched-chain amino acid ABC transporter permease [Rhodospirillaceae bacterium]|tara:strand:- start:912 stop:1973 length:1062 start_codon:yes stop_codon:yes gene_type:complete